MRTRLLTPAGLLRAALLGGLVAAAGCDDITSGQLSEQSGPPKLLKILVQNARPNPAGVVTDILDMRSPIACSDTDRCIAGGFGYPAGDCLIPMGQTSGICPDPLSPDPAAGGQPPAIDQITGLNQVRLIFSKLLDPKLESVVFDPNTQQANYKLPDGIVTLIGPDGKPVALLKEKAPGKGFPGSPTGLFYDPAGSPTATSSPANIPFGPAIVIKPAGPLAPDGKYTIMLNTDLIVDRKGQKAVDINGGALPSSFTFTMEGLRVLTATPPDSTMTTLAATIKPDDVIQLSFNTGVDETSVMGSIVCGSKTFMIEAWSDRGTDPMMCDANLTDTLLDVAAVTAPGMPTDLTDGASCTLSLMGIKDDGAGTAKPFSVSFTFKVMGPKDPMDPYTVNNYVLPEQCVTPPMGDMAMPKPVDGGTNG